MIDAEPYYPELYDTMSRHLRIYASRLLGSRVESLAREAAMAAYDVIMKGFSGDKSAYPCSDAIGNVRDDLHPFAVRIVKQHFPSARIIVIVRDPRSVFVSLQHYLDYFRPGWSKEIDPEQFGMTWARQNQQWLDDGPHAVVRYEDLKSDFGETLRTMFKKVGIPVEDDKLIEIESRVYDIDKLRSNQPEIFRNGQVDEWRDGLDPDTLARIEGGAQYLMKRFRYV